jgi:hypothetical protein
MAAGPRLRHNVEINHRRAHDAHLAITPPVERGFVTGVVGMSAAMSDLGVILSPLRELATSRG